MLTAAVIVVDTLAVVPLTQVQAVCACTCLSELCMENVCLIALLMAWWYAASQAETDSRLL